MSGLDDVREQGFGALTEKDWREIEARAHRRPCSCMPTGRDQCGQD